MKYGWLALSMVGLLSFCASSNAQDLDGRAKAAVAESTSLEVLQSRLITELAFHFAATNHVSGLKKLCAELKSGRDPRDQSGNSLLHFAVQYGARDTCNWLIETGMDVDVTNKQGLTPMCLAAKHGHPQLIQTLFEAGANLNGTTSHGVPQVLAAAAEHDVTQKTLKLLLDLGADPDMTDTDGNTALHFAAQNGSVANVRCLVENGANVTAQNLKKENPLSIAQRLYSTTSNEKGSMRDWGTEQLIGPPNSTNGDCRMAWASKSQDGQEEWLIVEFEEAVVPQGFEIYENLGPKAVNRISWLDRDGAEHEIWAGEDPAVPNESGVHVASIDVDMESKANRFKIYIDSVNVANWNEIDAVGLLSDGKKQWVSWAEASSCYAGGDYRGSNYRSIFKLLKVKAAAMKAEKIDD